LGSVDISTKRFPCHLESVLVVSSARVLIVTALVRSMFIAWSVLCQARVHVRVGTSIAKRAAD
jgi:hypothetical protein